MSLSRLFSPTACQLSRSTLHHIALFHTALAWRSESASYYETLGVDSNATAGEIKKRFYLLSKTHHPDHNPNDPQASEHFIKISEAYSILGSPQKRARYDRDFQSSQSASRSDAPRGSHSGSSTPFGSRPASGLSRRRTQFKGPPPSFYRSGGWGSQASRRQAQAEGSGSASTDAPRGGGFGPGQGQAGYNDVAHFDKEGHHRTQEQQDRRRRRRTEEGSIVFVDGGSVLFQFFLVSAVITLALAIPTIFHSASRDGRKKKDQI